MMSMPGNTSQTRADIIRQFLPTSPYVGHLGIQLTNMQPDVATLTLCQKDHKFASSDS